MRDGDGWRSGGGEEEELVATADIGPVLAEEEEGDAEEEEDGDLEPEWYTDELAAIVESSHALDVVEVLVENWEDRYLLRQCWRESNGVADGHQTARGVSASGPIRIALGLYQLNS